MKHLLKNRMALSTVVTTLIILVVSVLLAGVVTYFAINVVSTRVQEESLNLRYQHVWFNSSTGANPTSEAAVLVVNTGGRDVVFDNIAVRGQTCPWTNVYYNVTATPITTDLTYTSPLAIGNQTGAGGSFNYTLATITNPVTLKSGYTMILYIKTPDSISVNDVGLTVAMTIFTAQATYYKETNVEAVS
jgi:hypothetical protein